MSRISFGKYSICAIAFAGILSLVFYNDGNTSEAIVIAKNSNIKSETLQILQTNETPDLNLSNYNDDERTKPNVSFNIEYVDITQPQVTYTAAPIPTSSAEITVPKTPNIILLYENDAITAEIDSNSMKSFKLYRKTNGGSYSEIGVIAGNKYIDSDISDGNTYSYKATCTREDGTMVYSNENSIEIEKLQAIEGLTAVCDLNEITLSWHAVANASCYNIYREKDGHYIKIAVVSAKAYADSSLAANSEYTYKVDARDNKGNKIAVSDEQTYKTLYLPGAPELILYSNDEYGIEIAWSVDKNAISYNVYKYITGKYVLVKNTKSNYYIDENASGTCAYAVSAVSSAGEGEMSNTITVTAVK